MTTTTTTEAAGAADQPTPQPPAESSTAFSRLAVLLFTDIVGSTELKTRLGNNGYARLLARHDAIFKRALDQIPVADVINDTGDGYLVVFPTTSDAVRFALLMQRGIHDEPWPAPRPLRVSIGIHLGEIADIADAGGRPRVIGLAIDLAGRLTALATGGQVLLTRAAFDEARQFLREYPAAADVPLRWVAHGEYLFKGAGEPVEVFEVGGEGIAPLAPPPNSDKARRSVSAEQEETLGWRAAVGLEVPQRTGWLLERKLGEGTFGEVWLARNEHTHQHRVFKFCFDAERLRSFKRELTLFRLLRDTLGERTDIARLYDVRLDSPPFFLESEYAAGGNLVDWAAAQPGGLAGVPLAQRLELLAKVCDAVAAAHSIGILHKDVKPTNILMHADPADGTPRPQLSDFGIGAVVDRQRLAERHITPEGLTPDPAEDSYRSGTRMYAPPESMSGRPFTTQGDVYALGVLLYQLVVADLDRPAAQGWERDVADDLLREDIAACLDGDLARRISARALAQRLRALPQRRAARDAERRLRAAQVRRRWWGTVAVAAVALALAAAAGAVFVYVQQQRIHAAKREAEWAHAALGLEQGTALHFAGRPHQSRAAFISGREAMARLGVSTLPAEVGLYRSYRDYGAPINTITGHTDGLMSVAWLPDGERICSTAEDGTARLWDAKTGTEIRPFVGHAGNVNSIAASPNGRWIVTGGLDQKVKVWEVATGAEVWSRDEASGEVRGVAFAPGGEAVLSAAAGRVGRLRLWDAATGAPGAEFTSPVEEPFYGCAFSADGTRVLATTYNNAVCVWDRASRTLLKRLSGHTGYVISAAFARDGRHVLSASFDQTLKLWDLDAPEGAESVRTFDGHAAGVRGVAFVGADEATALSCSMDGTLKLWDVATGAAIRTYAGHGSGVRGVAVAPDGRRAASAGIDRAVGVWDLTADRGAPTTRSATTVTSLACAADGATLLVGDAAGGVQLLDLATLRPLQRFVGHERPIDCVAHLSDGRRIFSADSDGNAKVWDIATARPLSVRPGPAATPATMPATATAPATSAITKRAAAAAAIATTAAAATTTPATRPTRVRGPDWVYTVVAPDGSIAVTTNRDRVTLDAWSPDTGRTIRVLARTRHAISGLAIAPDGRRLLCGDESGRMHVVDLATGAFAEPLLTSQKPADLDCFAFAADGASVLSGGHELVVRQWDLATRRELRAFAGHTLIVRAVAFGRDDRTIFSAGADRTLRMWDAASGHELNLAASYRLPVHAMAVVPPGDAVIAAAGPDIVVADVAYGVRHLEAEAGLAAARARLTSGSEDPAALASVGRWYAFRGDHEWAEQLLTRARARGANVSALTLARCYWALGRPADAAREFARARDAGEAPREYLNWCIAATTARQEALPAARGR